MNQPKLAFAEPAQPNLQQPNLQALEQMLGRELVWRDRLKYLCLLLFDLAVGVTVASLLLTEPHLPLRTQIAFGALIAGSVLWAAFFLWILSRRKVLFARQRVTAGRIALAFTSLFTLGSLVLALQVPALRTTGLTAALFGTLLVSLAAAVLLQARHRLRQLMERRDLLEGRLAHLGPSA